MRLAVAAVAMLTVRALAAPHSAGSASYTRQRAACLKVQRVVEALSESTLLSNTLMARGGSSNHESEATSTTKTSISEQAAMTAISMGADNPEEFIKRLRVEAGLSPKAESTDSKSKREASPQPWCFRRKWFCRKRDLLRVDSATEAGKTSRVTGSPSCWHTHNLFWGARQMFYALLRALGPNGEGTKAVGKHEATCSRPGNLYKQDVDAMQALTRRILSSLE